MEALENFIEPVRIGLMVLAAASFIAIGAWTWLRPQKQIDAEANLFQDDE